MTADMTIIHKPPAYRSRVAADRFARIPRDVRTRRFLRPALVGALLVASAACTGRSGGSPAPVSASPAALRPFASIQELMQSEIDTAADGIWDSVETVVTRAGTEEHQPRTPEEWDAVRRAAITLIEGTNLLVMEGRRVGARDFPAEADGALNSTQISERIAADRPTFNAYAVSLREAGLTALAAVDARDPAALMAAGGHLDEICEACHVTFWYPNQKIPALADAAHR